MSVTTKILTQFRGNGLKTLSPQVVIVRFKETAARKVKDATKVAIPASEPGKIHAAVLKEFSSPLIIENVEPPKRIQDHQVLMDVHYCALNASDVLLSKNLYSFEPKLPMVLGYELVGNLVEIGKEAESNGYRVGDKVIALNKDIYGGLAEKCIAEVADIWKLPTNIKSLDAVSVLDNYVTALIALERKVSINEDDLILINIGISGIGLAAVDLATNVFRAKVIGVCATESGACLAREKGAFASLKFKDRKLLKQIEEIAAERDIKAIFNDVDGDYFKKVLSCFTDIYKDDGSLKNLLRDDNFAVVVHYLSREGRLIVAGSANTMMEAQSEVQNGSFSVSGFNLQEFRKKYPDKYRQAGDEVMQFLEEGLITPDCSLIIGLHNVNEALEYATEKKSGKVIIDIRNKEIAATAVVIDLKDKDILFKDRKKYGRYLLTKYREEWYMKAAQKGILNNAYPPP